MLKTVPLKNTQAKVNDEEADHVKVTVNRKKPGYLVPPISWVVRPRTTKTVQLDRLGTSVWKLCDGQRNVEAITDIFSSDYRLSFHEARVAVSNYMKTLMEKGVIVMMQQTSQPRRGSRA